MARTKKKGNKRGKKKGMVHRCPTCKVVFPTIDAVNDHYKETSHTPLPYKCESCERLFKNSFTLQKVGIELSVLIELLIS